MRTATLTITIIARADSSESRIKEALIRDLRHAWDHHHAQPTEDGQPVWIISVIEGTEGVTIIGR